MNRRNFTERLADSAQKELSKLSDKVKPVSYGKTEFFKSEKDMIERITGKIPFHEGVAGGVRVKWRRV